MPPKKSKKGSKKEAEAKNDGEAKKEEEKAEGEAPAEVDTNKEAAKEDGGKKDDDDKKEVEEKDDKKKKKAGKKKAEEEEKANDDDDKKETKDEDNKEEGEDGDEKGDKKSKKRGRAKEEKPVPTPSGREKRARKSVAEAAYKPEDFSQTDNSPHFIDGKGSTLEDLDAVKESIESYKDNAEELAIAHRFLFATRGRINAKEVKPALLRFNGYLAKPAEGAEKADIEKAEKAAEVSRKSVVHMIWFVDGISFQPTVTLDPPWEGNIFVSDLFVITYSYRKNIRQRLTSWPFRFWKSL